MICPYCGQENAEDVEICGFCGGSLLETTQHTEPATPSMEPKVEVIQAPIETHAPDVAPSHTPPPPTGGIYGNKVWWVVGCVVILCLALACIGIAYGIYRYSGISNLLTPAAETPTQPISQIATSTADLALQLTASELFFDDFSTQDFRWDQVDEADYSTNYYQGKYRITVNAEMSESWANPHGLQYNNVIIEVEAAKNGGADDNDYGVICRYIDSTQYYYGIISSDGYYGITKVSSESTHILGSDHLEYSDLINQGFATNHIRFECVGSQLSLYVNGELLDQQTDVDYASGNVGLIAGTYDTPGTDILFDNFKVSAP